MLIVHGGAVYLNTHSIGKNFTCYQSVTLGKNKSGIPTVGDNVTVYPGAVIVGDIYLGNNSTIGANSYVDKNVDENITIIGASSKVKK